ncbi:hypothetical protein HPB52_000234 [Rhipicephalus sanguineus]|uniref:RNase H type-1 domain-containing protein n=1 Tax=Rhipicephalus sanguineus TaxID=34632 RepID=A0A9D4PQP1_RHISA|nr:hypothetical protein HPB52_000234 [Rhipicephalus sanguineus]
MGLNPAKSTWDIAKQQAALQLRAHKTSDSGHTRGHPRGFVFPPPLALQLLLHAPPIELELRRLNREFTLFVLRQPVECDGNTYDADNVALPIDRWTRHPAQTPQERPVCRLSVHQARAMARNQGLHVYTDGSHTSRSSGAAYVAFGRGTTIQAVGRYRVQGATSAYSTELVAFTEALIYLRVHYTDCLSVLQAIASPHCLDPRVQSMRELMAQISASRQIQAFHVPGHRGLFGNEIADYLAERACRVGLVRTVPQSVRDVRARLRQEMIANWARDWSEHNTSTELYKWTPDVTNLPAYYPPNRHLVTLLTGHGGFPSYFFRFGLMDEAICPCGGESMTIDHYFTVCPLTAHLVSQLRYSADLATDDRRRVLADDRNRALLTWMVAVISDDLPDISHTTHGTLFCHRTGPLAQNGEDISSTRVGRARIVAAPDHGPAYPDDYDPGQRSATSAWTPPPDTRMEAEEWTGADAHMRTSRRLQCGSPDSPGPSGARER